MIELRRQADGYVIPLLVQPGASRDRICGEQGGRLKIAVTAPPEDGKANDALTKLLCRHLGLKRSQIQIISGHRSRQKQVFIKHADKSNLEAMLT